MEFLKEILGEELFNQFSEKINAYNGNEANKDKLIKLANLGTGEYVSKAKHDALQALLEGTKGNDELQGKVTAYETQVEQLQEQLKQTQVDAELKVAMLSAGAKADDIDYLTFKLNSKGKKLEIGEDGHIKGVDEMIAGLKTQFPSQFESAKNGTVIEENRLPGSENRETEPQSLADALKMQYENNPN